MPKAIGDYGMKGRFPYDLAHVKAAIHDGDTINIITVADSYFPTRFCGVDTPEVSYKLPKKGEPNPEKWTWEAVQEFKEYLSNPFDEGYARSKEFRKAIGEELIDNHLQRILNNEETAYNHQKYADRARNELVSLVVADRVAKTAKGEEFTFFMSFSHEPLDRFGRFLSWLEPYEYESSERKELTYNEVMLRNGYAVPYFIWPNVSPFAKSKSIVDSLPCREDFAQYVTNDHKLSRARDFVKDARKDKIGLYEKDDPLILMPFELRFLADRNTGKATDTFKCEGNNSAKSARPLSRYVIDISKAEDPLLMRPSEYYKIRNPEDRLLVPEHFVPLFKEKKYAIQEV